MDMEPYAAPWLPERKMFAKQNVFREVLCMSAIEYDLSPADRMRHYHAFDTVTNRMTHIKNNPHWTAFLSDATNVDVAAGLDGLQHIPLLVTTKPLENACEPIVRGGKLKSLSISVASHMNACDTLSFHGVIAHELGHAVMLGTQDERYYHYSMDYELNHATELAADALSLAFYPHGRVGRYVVNSKQAEIEYCQSAPYYQHSSNNLSVPSKLARLYEEGTLSQDVAQLMADYFQTRNNIVCQKATETYKQIRILPKELRENEVQKLNQKYEMMNQCYQRDASMTHPSALVRAVKGDAFSKKLKAFEAAHPL